MLHSKYSLHYSNCILFEFLDARTVFGSHSGSILTAFVFEAPFNYKIQELFGQQSNCTHIAFEVHSELNDSNSEYSYYYSNYIRAAFES